VNKVIVLDQAMRAILESHGGRDVRVIPNWEIPLPVDEALQSRDLIRCIEDAKAKYRYLVLYTGNYGWGHDITILFDWLREHPQQRDFFFLFVGGGEKWQDLFTFRARFPNCVGVFPYIPKTQMRSLLECADFGLVTLERSCVGLMSPSKIHGYLMSGKPLIHLGSAGSNVADAIAEFDCGIRIDEHDVLGLKGGFERITAGDFDYAAAARNASHAAMSKHAENVGVRDLIECLEQ
jgi:hypothetical protein